MIRCITPLWLVHLLVIVVVAAGVLVLVKAGTRRLILLTVCLCSAAGAGVGWVRSYRGWSSLDISRYDPGDAARPPVVRSAAVNWSTGGLAVQGTTAVYSSWLARDTEEAAVFPRPVVRYTVSGTAAYPFVNETWPTPPVFRRLGFQAARSANDNTRVRSWNVAMPFWFPTALLILPPLMWAAGLRRRRRARRRAAGRCEACGYDIRAATTYCPECGTRTPATAPAEAAASRRRSTADNRWLGSRRRSVAVVAAGATCLVALATSAITAARGGPLCADLPLVPSPPKPTPPSAPDPDLVRLFQELTDAAKTRNWSAVNAAIRTLCARHDSDERFLQAFYAAGGSGDLAKDRRTQDRLLLALRNNRETWQDATTLSRRVDAAAAESRGQSLCARPGTLFRKVTAQGVDYGVFNLGRRQGVEKGMRFTIRADHDDGLAVGRLTVDDVRLDQASGPIDLSSERGVKLGDGVTFEPPSLLPR